VARFFRQVLGAKRDRSISEDRFGYVDKLPGHVVKIAESGVSAANCAHVLARGFHSILVGTSLLMDPRGVNTALQDFEAAIKINSGKVEPAPLSTAPR
jgi:hypothetical protein